MKKMESLIGNVATRRRNAGAMAIGTIISRVTGLLRLSAIAWALGIYTISDIFNLSNNAPNTFFDLLIGGVLASTIVPVMVKASSRKAKNEVWESLSAITTVTVGALIIATLIFELVAGLIIHGYFLSNHAPNRDLQIRAAINLLRFFAPQLFFYGVISIGTALLNTFRHFAVPAFAPIANNVIAIITLAIFHFSFSSLTEAQKLNSLANGGSLLWLLGIGTTAGVALQCAIVLYAMRGRGFALSVRFDLSNPAVKEITRLSGWTFGYVLANQVSLFFMLTLAEGHSPGSVSAYNNSYLFFQLPYGIAAFSVMAAILPDLAEYYSHHEIGAFRRNLTRGARISVALLIPFSAIYVTMSHQIVQILLGHGAASAIGINLTSKSLIALGLGLPGFGAYLALVQGFQSARRAKEVFWIYFIENLLNIILAIVLIHSYGVFGLALSVSISYSVSAVIAAIVMRRLALSPYLRSLLYSWIRIAIPSLAMGIVIKVVSNYLGASNGAKLIVYIGVELILGSIAFGSVVALGYGISTITRSGRTTK
ncbi:murein biosynthesis integral membrane protein MurJ [Acidithrix sp. C25]|uniref:Putative peptidoglycan biosynthesis protein MviN n=2 Tax=Acidithrix ferrooxidans TaxID=1280514 RepID=A0A0D8HFU5_9ACTN|nr:murein biosynthesis integral membrane protein MurJ [Acidithrix sp. C25]KJF16759.1 putative peptidoglycan biosynthesis protein MviN [Acidithrix ferrooxidans]CAG4934506.1 unnamed protein product [Acidithrix sp. C25]